MTPEQRIAKLEELLAFALDNLRFVIPYSDPHSEYDYCAVCRNPEWEHHPDCEGVQWKKEVTRLLKGE